MAGIFSDFDPVQSLAANQYGMSGSAITRGSLVSFDYPVSYGMVPNVIHDPRPMVILTDIWPPRYIRGINLHYLTFPYVKKILESWGGNQGFTYLNIKMDAYMVQAFRTYSMKGIRRPKRLDSEWLKSVLASVRSFDPSEIEKIRTNIQQQIQSRLQAKAEEMTAYDKWRKSLSMGDQRQLSTRVMGAQDALTGGVDRGLMSNPSNISPPNPQTTPPNQQVNQTDQDKNNP